MPRHALPESFQPGTVTYIIPTYGRIRWAKVVKRTATQITTEDLQGRKDRWISGWVAGSKPGEECLQPYGSAATGFGPPSARLVLDGSEQLKDERDRRKEAKRQADLNAALDTARRHGRVKDLEALLALLPGHIEHAKAAAAASL